MNRTNTTLSTLLSMTAALLVAVAASGCATLSRYHHDDEEEDYLVLSGQKGHGTQIEKAAESLWDAYQHPTVARHPDARAERDTFRALIALDVAIHEMNETGDSRPVAEAAYCAVHAMEALDGSAFAQPEVLRAAHILGSFGHVDTACSRSSHTETSLVNKTH